MRTPEIVRTVSLHCLEPFSFTIEKEGKKETVHLTTNQKIISIALALFAAYYIVGFAGIGVFFLTTFYFKSPRFQEFCHGLLHFRVSERPPDSRVNFNEIK